MNLRIFIVALFAIILAACNQQNKSEADHEGHDHETEAAPSDEHELEETKFQFTAYSDEFELFAEADAFVAGETSNVLSHFTILPDFKALESGTIKLVLTVNGKETGQTLEKPTRKGIYSFDIKPETSGTGTLKFIITNKKGTFEVIIPQVTVFTGHPEAHAAAREQEIQKPNTTIFTKEQSWKIDFKTEQVKQEPFGQVIKTVAKVESNMVNEKVVVAKTSGIVLFSDRSLLEGSTVTSGQNLFQISSGGISQDNISVKLAEAKNNFENAETNYERKKELAKDKIISDKELLDAKNAYDNAKVVYENLKNNFGMDGQSLKSPITGFVKQIFVVNGQFVESGQPIITISQNQTLILSAPVQQTYSDMLSTIHSANIKTLYDNQTYTFEELNGKVVSYGKSVNEDNFLIPVNLQIDNTAGLVQGSLVEVYLKTLTNAQAVTVPNTALLEEQGNYFVFVQLTPELFEKRQIITGVTDGIRTEIISGLPPHERIVSKGAMLVKLAQASGALDPHSGHVH